MIKEDRLIIIEKEESPLLFNFYEKKDKNRYNKNELIQNGITQISNSNTFYIEESQNKN